MFKSLQLLILILLTGFFTSSNFGLALAENVTFSSPDIQPTPFKVKRAKAKGITLEPTPGLELQGILAEPQGDGPHPAVVILSGSGGLLTSQIEWGKTLADWGYVSLLVDSFRARGGTNVLDTPAIDMTVDAYAAFTFLSQRANVDPDNIGILGFSMGASFIFPVMRDVNRTRPATVHFKAGVAFYPTCNVGDSYASPILVLFGRDDILTSLRQCENLVDDPGAGGNIKLHVYDGATHFFDSRDFAKDTSLHGPTWRKPLFYEQNNYDPAAHADSVNRTRAFFESHLAAN